MEKISVIKKEEGLKLKAYLCSAGVPTIGYGTTIYPDGKKVKLGDVCTEQEAENYLRNYVEKNIKLPDCKTFNENQQAAMCSLIYNIGQAAFNKSTVRKKIISESSKEEISKAWLMWNKVRDPKTKKLKISEGLTSRRKRELTIFFS